MKVRGLPFDPGLSGWNEILPAAHRHPELSNDTTADFLVIGGGFAGLSAARRLRQKRTGARIIILEARCIAEGPAGRNSGFMIDVPHDIASDDYGGDLESDRLQLEMNRFAIDFAGNTATEYDMPEEAFTRTGKINAAATERGTRHNKNFARHLSQIGEPHELLDARQMQELTGTTYYRGGVFNPGTAMIQPALYVRCLADGLAKDGVVVHENSPVIDLARAGNDWKASTPQGSITTGNVVLAVNGRAESFGYFKRRLVHIFTYASMTRALNEDECKVLDGAARWGCTSADPLGTTVRRISGIGGDRIVIRNTFTYDGKMRPADRRLASIWQRHEQALAVRFPGLAGAVMDYRWGGQLCLARNNVAAVKELDEGLVSACCQNGLGTTRGTLGGMMAADHLLGERSRFLTLLLNQPLPNRLPPEPLAYIGANAVIRWGEYFAGPER